LLLASSSVLLLSGCGAALNFKSTGSVPATANAMQGTVHGGQFPVVGATVRLYEIGATQTSAAGYGAALGTPLGTATTAADGTWAMGGTSPNPLTPCTNGNDELYLVASGGAGGSSSQNVTSNTALVMTSVGGPCNNQFTNSFNIDEVTTVATEYALSGFSTDYQHVGTSPQSGTCPGPSCNPGNSIGLTNAFATVTNLVNLTSGQANSIPPAYVTPPTNGIADVWSAIVPYDTINTLANVLATCVNASGGATDPACTSLFSFTGGTNSLPPSQGHGVTSLVATNTADAALYIAENPGLPASSGWPNNNLVAVWSLPTGTVPFGPVLGVAPPDFTLALSFVGGGLGGTTTTSVSRATQLTIDLKGGVWIVDSGHTNVASLSNLGTPLSPTTQLTATGALVAGGMGGYKPSGLVGTSIVFLDTDQQGNVWIPDGTNCLIGISSTGAQLNSGAPYSVCPSTGANSAAVDASNNVWVSGPGPSFISAISNPSGTALFAPVTGGLSTLTGFLAPDESGNVWFTDGGQGNGGYVNGTGTVTIPWPSAFGAPGAFGAFGPLGAGSGGNGGLALWIPEDSVNTIQPVNATTPYGNPGATFIPEAGMWEIQADGLGRYFFSSTNGYVAEFTSNEAQISPGSPTNVGYTGGSAVTGLSNPEGMAIDQSGNVWLCNQNNWNAGHKTVGPYANKYKSASGGTSAAAVTEFVGLAAPSQPVKSLAAKYHTYGQLP
jgi:hypothetical protein